MVPLEGQLVMALDLQLAEEWVMAKDLQLLDLQLLDLQLAEEWMMAHWRAILKESMKAQY